jgi:RNA polymerase sigma factor (sigma-70 family)
MLFSSRKTYKSLSDEELVLDFKATNSNGIIGEIYTRYGHLVMGTSMKYMKNKADAEDIAMHVFEQLPAKLHSHSIQRFKSWLYMVTKNECLMVLRKKGRLTAEITKELEATDELHLKEDKEVQLNLLEAAVDTLKDEQKKCIQLFYLEQRSYQEIMKLLQLDLNKVKSAIQNGKRNLKIKLEDRNEFKSAI